MDVFSHQNISKPHKIPCMLMSDQINTLDILYGCQNSFTGVIKDTLAWLPRIKIQDRENSEHVKPVYN